MRDFEPLMTLIILIFMIVEIRENQDLQSPGVSLSLLEKYLILLEKSGFFPEYLQKALYLSSCKNFLNFIPPSSGCNSRLSVAPK